MTSVNSTMFTRKQSLAQKMSDWESMRKVMIMRHKKMRHNDDDERTKGFSRVNLHEKNVKSYELTCDAITHMFLPKRTPATQQANLEEIEELMLESFNNSIQEALVEVHLTSTKLMFQKWLEIQPRSHDLQHIQNFQKEITALEKGNTLPIYVRKQNSTLFITKQEDGALTVATYRSSLPGEAVMSTVGSHSLTFPETMETIGNIEMIQSEDFAKQLHELAVGDIEISLPKTTKGGREYNETRDVANPHLVSDWIIGLLVPVEDTPQVKRPNIQKKIRDQVTFTPRESRSLPFRRSGMYMSLKVALQLKLLENLDNDIIQAKYIYKILMMRILIDMVKKFYYQGRTLKEVDMDLSSQILAKLGSRLQKLQKLSDGISTAGVSSEAFEIMKSNLLEHSQSVVNLLSYETRNTWDIICSKKSKTDFADNKYDFSKDVEHKIPLLDNYIEALKTVSHDTSSRYGRMQSIADTNNVGRYDTVSSILAFSDYSCEKDKLRIWLQDTEKFVKFDCTIEIGANDIQKILKKYLSKAQEMYGNNPLGMSQMSLVSLKGLYLLDQIVTKALPSLVNYKLEINVSHFDQLLLPYVKDIKLLEELLDYFVSRDQRARQPGKGVLGRHVNESSFGVCYALNNETMKSLRETILAEIEQGVQKKFKELDATREQCREMERRIERDMCCCEFHETKSYKRYGKWFRVKISTCDKCNLRPQLKRLRNSVSYYERALPEQSTLQWAVVFELLIPEDFTIWRDFLALFKYEILGETIFHGESNGSLATKWLQYNSLRMHTRKSCTSLRLGSTNHPTLYTYHTKQNLDVLASSNNEDFIVPNGMNCFFHYDTVGTPTKCFKTSCTFQISDTCNHGSYESLQKMLKSTTHTQNEVLASQYECHQKLSLHEFIAFGSLRAGHRIQLRNLFESIHSGTLSLEQEPVLALILQTIWQVGPRNADKLRESHLDFQDDLFAEEFLELLDCLVKTNEANYSNSLIILTSVIITTRIAELNASLETKCYVALKKWRIIMAKWIKRISLELDKKDDNLVHGATGSLRRNLSEIVMCMLLSYNISCYSKVDTVLKDEEDVIYLLETLYYYHQTIKEQRIAMSSFMKGLLQFAQNIFHRMQLYQKIAVEQQDIYVGAFRKFICRFWDKAAHLEFLWVCRPLETEKNGNSIAVTEYAEGKGDEKKVHQVTFDLILGSFLVNGYCESKPPQQVKSDKLFKMYFKNDSDLRVQQDSENLTSTITTFHGRHYEFHHNIKISSLSSSRMHVPQRSFRRNLMRDELDSDDDYEYYDSMRHTYLESDSDDDYERCDYSPSYLSSPPSYTDVIIKEIKDDGTKLVLLDPEKFQSCLANYFLIDYTHWLDPQKSTAKLQYVTNANLVTLKTLHMNNMSLSKHYK